MSCWQPIETAPKDSALGLDPLILIGRVEDGIVMWAMAARWSVAMYGYTTCASRSGWAVDYMPQMAMQHHSPKQPGEWIIPHQGFGPTHWMPLPASPAAKTEVAL